MKKLLLLLITIALISCSKEENSLPDSTMKIMDFENLEIGQKFYYSLLIGEKYYEESGNDYSYTGDTLLVEVIEKTGNSYIISERITEGSAMKSGVDTDYWLDPDSIFTNTWRIENDSLLIDSDFELFFSINSHLLSTGNLSLDEFNNEEVQVNGWKTDHEYIESDKDLYVKDYMLFGNEYSRLNVSIKNSFMAGDGPGNTTFFSKNDGIIRTSKYSWWTGEGYGWDRIK